MKGFKYSKILIAVFGSLALFVLFALGLFILLKLGTFVYLASIYLNESFFQLEPGTVVPLAFTLITAVLGLTATLVTQARSRRQAIEEAHRERKVEMYHRLLTLIMEIQLATKPEFDDLDLTGTELIRRMAGFKTELTLWASPDVLNAFYDFTHQRADETPLSIMKKVDPLYCAIRKDMGLTNYGLAKNYFVKSMLNDPKELDSL